MGADSRGIRSMATFVEVSGIKVAFDPGVSFAPRRYGLPPHQLELERLEEVRSQIIRELEDSTHVVITHYHYDHYLYKPEDAEYYRGKILIVKHPTRDINVNQRIRAHRLLKKNKVEQLAREVIYADNNALELDKGVMLAFSKPVPHGPEGTPLGKLVMALLTWEGVGFAYASDVQGPLSSEALNILLSWRPSLVYISGPPTYFEGYRVTSEQIQGAIDNLAKIAEVADTVIADHHMARDKRYPRILAELAARSRRARIVSAAEYMGYPMELLEAWRDELWGVRRGTSEATDSD